jgi:translocation and assembly module TamB
MTASDEPSDSSASRSRLGRVLRVAGLIAAVVVLGVVGLVGVLQFDAVATWAGRTVAGAASSDSFRIRLGGVSLRGLTHVRVTAVDAESGPAGEPTLSVSVDTVALGFRLVPLLRRHVSVEVLRVVGASVSGSPFSGDGAASADDDASDGGWTFGVDRLEVDVREIALALPEASSDEPWRLSEGRLRARDVSFGGEVVGALDTLHARFRPPRRPDGWGRVAASGRLEPEHVVVDGLELTSPESDVRATGRIPLSLTGTAPEGLTLDLEIARLHLADVGPFLPADMADSVRVRGSVQMRAQADTLRLTGSLGASVPGRLDVEARVWGPREAPDVDAHVEVSAFDAEPWGFLDRSVVARLDMTLGLRSATLEGVHGSLAAELDVEDASGPLDGRASLSAESDGADDPWRGDWSLAGLGVAVEGRVSVGALERPEWTIDGEVEYAASADAGADFAFSPRSGSGRFEAAGTGLAPGSLDARAMVVLDSLRAVVGGGAEDRSVALGPGRIEAELSAGSATGRGTLEVAGGDVDLALEGDVTARTGRLTRGRVRDVDVAALVGDTVASRLSADFTGELTSAEPLTGSGRVDVLAARYGPWSVDSASVSATARGGTLDVALRAAVPDSGRFAARVRGLSERGVFRTVQIDSLGWRHLDARALAPGHATDSSAVPRTDLSGSGSGRLTRGEEGWSGTMALALLPSVIGTASVDTGRLDARFEPNGLELEASLTAGEGRLSGQAEVWTDGDVRTLRVPSLSFQALDLGALSGGSTPPTALEGALSAAFTGSSVEAGSGMLTLDLAPSRVDTLVVDTLSVRVDLEDGVARAAALAELLEAVATLEGEYRVAAQRPTYTLSGRLSRPSAEGRTGPVGFARLGAEGEGIQIDSARATLWMEVDSGSLSGHPIEVARARVALDRGSFQLDTLDLRMAGLMVSGGGALPASAVGGPAEGEPPDPDEVDEVDEAGNEEAGEIRIEAALTRSDVLTLLPLEGPIALGEATLEVVLRGTVDAIDVEGAGNVSALLVGDIRVQGVDLDARGRRTRDEGWVAGEASLAVERMRLPTAPVQSVDIDVRLEPESELSVTASAVIDGRRDVELAARVEDRAAPSAVRLEHLAFRADEDRWTLQHPTRVAFRDGFSVDSLLLATPDQELRVRGSFASEGPLDVQASVTEFEISTVFDLLGYPALRGSVSGEADLSGTAAAPVLAARLESRLTPADAPAADLEVGVDYRERSASLEGTVTLDSGPSLQAEVTVPFDAALTHDSGGFLQADPMSGYVSAEAFPVSWLEPFVPAGGARELEGVLAGRAELGGTPGNPALSGSLTLRDGAATLPALGVRYTGARARMVLDGARIALDSTRLHTADGSVSATGEISFENLAEPAYDIELAADQFEIMRTSSVRATVSGDVRIEGVGAAPAVSGVVDVERADLYLGDLASGSSVDPVVLTDAQWDELARVFGYERPSERAAASPFMDAVELDLDVRLGRASWVRQRANPELAIQFSGDMAVTKERGDSIQLVGSVEAVPERSWVEQFGRRFSIEQGRLTFRGSPSATMVDVVAEYDVPSRENPGEPEVVLTLTVGGTPDDLSLELSSTPQLEASDMVSYLVTGRPASQSLEGGSDGSLTGTGGALALGQLSGAVEAYAREQVGLDVVEITTDGMDGLTLLAGRYLSPRLYLGIRQPISFQSSRDDPTQRAPDPEIEAELQAVRWLLLNLRAGGRIGMEFYVRSRIAYD